MRIKPGWTACQSVALTTRPNARSSKGMIYFVIHLSIILFDRSLFVPEGVLSENASSCVVFFSLSMF
jgi:hypothetical protein